MKRFSIILPTRKRSHLLKDLFKSIESNTLDIYGIETLVAVDDDDFDTIRFLEKQVEIYPWLQFHVRCRGKSISRDYHNWLYNFSRGKFVFVLNDDCVFQTRHWDEIAYKKLENHLLMQPVRVIYGITMPCGVNDSSPYAEFPILSREGIDALGYVMCPSFPGWAADLYLYKVYERANCLLDLKEVCIHHLRIGDETHNSMASISAQPAGHFSLDDEVNRMLGPYRRYYFQLLL